MPNDPKYTGSERRLKSSPFDHVERRSQPYSYDRTDDQEKALHDNAVRIQNERIEADKPFRSETLIERQEREQRAPQDAEVSKKAREDALKKAATVANDIGLPRPNPGSDAYLDAPHPARYGDEPDKSEK